MRFIHAPFKINGLRTTGPGYQTEVIPSIIIICQFREPFGLLQLTGDIEGLRVGLLKEGFNPSFETDVNDLVRKSAERLSTKGAVVEEVSIPWHLDGKYILSFV